jgi:hypothetical protein
VGRELSFSSLYCRRIHGLRPLLSKSLELRSAPRGRVSPVEEGFIGVEARYLHKYDGLGFAPLSGEAVFVGPNIYMRFSKSLAVSAAWSGNYGLDCAQRFRHLGFSTGRRRH